MSMKKVPLTKWQRRHQALIEEALLNSDIYQELGYIRRDTNSIRAIDDSEAYLDERILRLINKYRAFGLEDSSFKVLKKFCSEGGDFDYSLVPRYRPGSPKPKSKVHPEAVLHRTIYDMWIRGLKSIAEITDTLRSHGILGGKSREEEIQRVSRIVKRMNARDPNHGPQYGPTPGRRTQKM